MTSAPADAPRKYDSPMRRQRVAETRDRIVAAGCRLLQHSSIRDWRAITVRAVADQAGVNERTVYRYFGNERGLRDAVMHRLEQDAGIDLDGMLLEDIADVAARIFTHVSAYPVRPKPVLDPTLADANLRQRHALLEALDGVASTWHESERTAAAALLDVLWSMATYERLASDWEMAPDQASGTVTWAIDLVLDALRNGQRPR